LPDLVPAYTAKTSQELSLNSGFWQIGAIFAGIEFAGLLNLVLFAGERPGSASCQSGALRLSITVELDRLAAIYIHNTCHSFFH
jgi:hypothetical protein